jgi:organic hydroperoxide reductase OsmC/OhrA
MAQADIREYQAQARSTDTFGRVLCSARDHHFVVDGPVQNGCPGEEVTPPEAFLSGIASCGVELLQVIAREQGVPLARVGVAIHATLDRGNQPRTDVTLFNRVRLRFTLGGTDASRAAALVEGFKRR